MKQGIAGNQAVERLKAIFMLGLTSNLTTFVGLILIWILAARHNLVSDVFEVLLTVLPFTPIFMADAINHYCLGRVRLEHLKGWDDIQITAEGRAINAHHYQLFRFSSILPSYLLAAAVLASLGNATPALQINLRLAFLAAFILHFARATWFLHRCVAPRLPGYGGHRLVWRTAIAATAFAAWFAYFSIKAHEMAGMTMPTGAGFTLIFGVFYFFLNAFIHPLPTRYSLLRPGKVTRREAFFSVEILDNEQFAATSNAGAIDARAASVGHALNLKKLNNIRLPLLELPLFQSWGSLFLDQSGKMAMLVLDSEVDRGIHRSLVSFAGDRIFITTDFGSPKAKFPEYVSYNSADRKVTDQQLLQTHITHIAGFNADDISSSICLKLENFIKAMISFLEKDAGSRPFQTNAHGVAHESDKQPDN